MDTIECEQWDFIQNSFRNYSATILLKKRKKYSSKLHHCFDRKKKEFLENVKIKSFSLI